MASARPGDFPASMAVLGLLIQQPDTIAGVSLRLDAQHPNARWSKSIVHNSVSSNVEKEYLCLAHAGAERSLDRYEATPEGREHFRSALRRSSATLPAMRDALRAKLKYVDGPDELSSAIEDIREQEELCALEREAAVARYRDARRLGRLNLSDERDWRTTVDRALLIDEVNIWHERSKGLRRLREHLEDPHGERDTLAPGTSDG
jgi:hypothetical protein